jgi:hypothetical protein
MHIKISLTMLGMILGVVATGLVTALSMIETAAATSEKDNAQGGLNEADENVHENTDSEIGDLSEQDIRFHEGTCQGGHSTDVLDTITGGGCPTEGFDPGNSDENRQD